MATKPVGAWVITHDGAASNESYRVSIFRHIEGQGIVEEVRHYARAVMTEVDNRVNR